MGNSPSSQVPTGGIGQAVLYVSGFSYHRKGCGQACSCSRSTQLLPPPSTGIGGVAPGSVMSQWAEQVPQELQDCTVTPQEFTAGIYQINVTAKRLVPAGLLNCHALGWMTCLLIVSAVCLRLEICEDDSPKDYWRTICVEMHGDCRSRQLEALDSLYPECRTSCTANMTDEELLSTANPDGGHCLLCPALPVDDEYRYSREFSRGCQCVPTTVPTVRDNGQRCETTVIDKEGTYNPETKNYYSKQPGCLEFEREYARVCDDVRHPIRTVGIALAVSSQLLLFGVYIWGHCIRNPSVDRDLESLCRTLSTGSQSGATWRYVTFTAGSAKQNFKCVVANSAVPTAAAKNVLP